MRALCTGGCAEGAGDCALYDGVVNGVRCVLGVVLCRLFCVLLFTLPCILEAEGELFA